MSSMHSQMPAAARRGSCRETGWTIEAAKSRTFSMRLHLNFEVSTASGIIQIIRLTTANGTASTFARKTNTTMFVRVKNISAKNSREFSHKKAQKGFVPFV